MIDLSKTNWVPINPGSDSFDEAWEHSNYVALFKGDTLTLWIKDPALHEKKTGRLESIAYSGPCKDRTEFFNIVEEFLPWK